MVAAVVLRAGGGELGSGQVNGLLQTLYWGACPLVFLALASLGIHVWQQETGRL